MAQSNDVRWKRVAALAIIATLLLAVLVDFLINQINKANEKIDALNAHIERVLPKPPQ